MSNYTIIIPTFNESANIKDCINSISIKPKIIVIDSFSDDDTIKISNQLGVQVISNKFLSHGSQITHALSFAKTDWIFVLDADERFPENLCHELDTLCVSGNQNAYRIQRINYFGKFKICHGSWSKDFPLRFFNKKFCYYNNKRVHASLSCNGEVGMLKNKLFHFSYKNIDHYLRKIGRFSRGAALDMYDIGKQTSPVEILSRSLFRFLKSYIFLRGYKDGKYGFFIALLESFYVALKYSMLLEMHIKTQQHK
jgi:glycosyltransferase involved in cell wall biosynthesis